MPQRAAEPDDTCGHVQANRPQDKSWAELLGLSVPEEFADLARRADEVIAAARRKGLDETYRRVFADCEHDHTHVEVRDPDSLHRRPRTRRF